MGIVMRIIQQFDPAREDQFMALERKFDELEKRRPDFPKGQADAAGIISRTSEYTYLAMRFSGYRDCIHGFEFL